MFGFILFLVTVACLVAIVSGVAWLRVVWRSSAASAAQARRDAIGTNHAEAIRLIETWLVRDEHDGHMLDAERRRAQQLVDEFHG
jgi:uncharacterized membrane protein